MGKLIVTYADHEGEISTVTLPVSDLTAANIDAEYAEHLALRNALNAVLRGKELKYSVLAKISPQGVGRAADPEAQREEKALVRYYDDTTFKRATLELPCVDMTTQNPDYPGVFFLDGASNNDADWETFVTAFEATVPGPSGNTSVVEDIIHVGRNT